MKYVFLVMSSKYKVEAKNEDIAFVTMAVYCNNPFLPIVLCEPYTKSRLAKDVMDMDDLDSFIVNNREEFIEARNSIEEV